jgi:hypothetical protein
MNIRRFLKRSFNPRSRHFLYTFAKPKLSAEERSKDLFFATLATVIAWELEPWIMPWGGGNLFASEGERMFDYVRKPEISPLKMCIADCDVQIVYAVNDDRRD